MLMASLHEAFSQAPASTPSTTTSYGTKANLKDDRKDIENEQQDSGFSLSRSLFVHGSTYLLRALPKELFVEEMTSIKAALPSGVRHNNTQKYSRDQSIPEPPRDRSLGLAAKENRKPTWRFSWPSSCSGVEDKSSDRMAYTHIRDYDDNALNGRSEFET